MEQNLYETREYRGVDIDIYYDDCPINPRKDCDHLTTIWRNNRNYIVDSLNIDDLISQLGLSGFPGSFANLCDIADKKGYFAIPIYAYIHGGLSLSLSRSGQFADRFDSGVFGVVTIKKEDIYDYYNCKRISSKLKERLVNLIKGEIEEYEAYANGDCYCYEILSGTSEEDSMGGFLGDSGLESLMEYAKDHIDSVLENRDKSAVDFWNNNIDIDIAA